MCRNLLNLQLLLILFLLPFSQAFAQNTPTKSQTSVVIQDVAANQDSPQQIIPFRFNISEAQREKQFWYFIKNDSKADDFRLFLEQFPNSTFAERATSKLKDFNAKAKPVELISESSTFEKPRVKLENTKAARENLYQGYFLPNYKGFDEQQQIAYEAAQDYIYNFASDDDEIVKYLKQWIDRHFSICKCINPNIQKINKAISEGKLTETFITGKNILSKHPDYLTVMLFMVDAGYLETYVKRVNKLNDGTIFYAQEAIKNIEAGKMPEVDNYYWAPFRDKNDALAWLNYDIAFIYHFRKQDINSAAPYFYQAAKYQYRATKYEWLEFSPSHIPYTILGEWYLDQYNQAAAEYNVVKDNPKTARAVKDKLAERWQILADRALEAYAHAYTLASKNRVKIPDTVGKIKTVLIELYRLRKNADDSELNAFAESLSKKPITDPAITVNP